MTENQAHSTGTTDSKIKLLTYCKNKTVTSGPAQSSGPGFQDILKCLENEEQPRVQNAAELFSKACTVIQVTSLRFQHTPLLGPSRTIHSLVTAVTQSVLKVSLIMTCKNKYDFTKASERYSSNSHYFGTDILLK